MLGIAANDCCLSQLPIPPNTPVRFLLLGKNPDGQVPRYVVGCDWQVFAGPIRAYYDGHGSIRDITDDAQTNAFWGSVYAHAVARSQGEGFSRVAVGPTMPVDDMLSAIARQRLLVSTPHYTSSAAFASRSQDRLDPPPPTYCPIRQAMVREDVWCYMAHRGILGPADNRSELARVQTHMQELGKIWYPGTCISKTPSKWGPHVDFHERMRTIASVATI